MIMMDMLFCFAQWYDCTTTINILTAAAAGWYLDFLVRFACCRGRRRGRGDAASLDCTVLIGGGWNSTFFGCFGGYFLNVCILFAGWLIPVRSMHRMVKKKMMKMIAQCVISRRVCVVSPSWWVYRSSVFFSVREEAAHAERSMTCKCDNIR